MTVLHAAEWHLLEMIKLADQKPTDVTFLCVIDLSTYRPLCNNVSVWLFDTHTVYTGCGRERCTQGQACVATWCQLESVTLPGIGKQRLHNITKTAVNPLFPNFNYTTGCLSSGGGWDHYDFTAQNDPHICRGLQGLLISSEKLIITRQMVRCLTVKLQILTQDTQKNPLHVSKATTANDNVSLGNNNMKFCISQIWGHKEKNVLLSV